VLQGRIISAYPQLAIDVQLAGATFENGGAVVDGNLVSARAWPDNGTWMGAFLSALEAAGIAA
jgi:protease I